MNHMLPYIPRDPSCGPFQIASLHACLLIDLLNSLILFPRSEEYWNKMELSSIQKWLYSLPSHFSFLLFLGSQDPQAHRLLHLNICNPQETNKLIPLLGTAGSTSPWIWCCDRGTPEPRSFSMFISAVINPLSHDILDSITTESRWKRVR